MAANPGDHGEGLWTFASAIAVVLGAAVALLRHLRRRIRGALDTWRKGPDAVNRRITDLAQNQKLALDEIRADVAERLDAQGKRQAQHDKDDEKRFAAGDARMRRLETRLEEISDGMARREDQLAIKHSLDELLVRMATGRRTRGS